MLRVFTILWLVITTIFAYEYFALNFDQERSVLYLIKAHGLLPQDFNISPAAGRPISWWLGWVGFGSMVLTNLYLLRKRVSFLKQVGSLNNWLSFHIFCGLLGPTFIVFHCNFKVGGLVAISFWSMMISFASGIVGRYFYVNMLANAQQSLSRSNKMWAQFLQYAERAGVKPDAPEVVAVRRSALRYAGDIDGRRSVIPVLIGSLAGDIRLFVGPPATLAKLPFKTRYILEEFAIHRRRVDHIEPFKALMGYWHTFHVPFAVFMYVVAVIHIISALFFGVTA